MKKTLSVLVYETNEVLPVVEFAYYDYVKARSYYGQIIQYDWYDVELMMVTEPEDY